MIRVHPYAYHIELVHESLPTQERTGVALARDPVREVRPLWEMQEDALAQLLSWKAYDKHIAQGYSVASWQITFFSIPQLTHDVETLMAQTLQYHALSSRYADQENQ